MDKALEQFHQHGAAQDCISFEVEVEVTTPRGSGKAKNKLAFVWINNLQYEIIQPVSGLVDVYKEQLPSDDSLRFHHHCVRVDDWDSFRQSVIESVYPVVLEGHSDELKYVYLDARDFLGHYIEYVWMTPNRWQQLGGK
ncbi:hypothetical protein [Halioxenophilus aromaticivorans]|uniref:Uncharacterized protein n=1 Tax=Halioxenophilus aromaticivorans TaxID=1306992 RepID=A0AAV3TY91_9ALTE